MFSVTMRHVLTPLDYGKPDSRPPDQELGPEPPQHPGVLTDEWRTKSELNLCRISLTFLQQNTVRSTP